MKHADPAGGQPEPPHSFVLTARAPQAAPAGDWRTWLFMGGRGAGKTRAGAEWVRLCALFAGCRRIALIGPTFSDVREVMIEGESGLRRIARPGETAPAYEVSRHRLVWPNGAAAYAFSAEDPDGLRGPQFDAAWCDEIAAWRAGLDVWDMLQMALRLGPAPRVVATTTPKPVPLVRQLVADPGAVMTRSRTGDNAQNLSPAFLAHIERVYSNTQLGRQEMDGELLDEVEGALWTRAGLAASRLTRQPGVLDDIIVAVDPPASAGPAADACGIIAAGRRRAPDGQAKGYILADATVRGLSPLDWAGRVAETARATGARRVVAEANQGGEMVRSILFAAGCDVPVFLQHAKVSKRARAMPVAALYEQGRVFHLGEFPALEDEMLTFGTSAMRGSPDRVDALARALAGPQWLAAGRGGARRNLCAC